MGFLHEPGPRAHSQRPQTHRTPDALYTALQRGQARIGLDDVTRQGGGGVGVSDDTVVLGADER